MAAISRDGLVRPGIIRVIFLEVFRVHVDYQVLLELSGYGGKTVGWAAYLQTGIGITGLHGLKEAG